jgi:hypothetical protein
LTVEKARRILGDLEGRLAHRKKELLSMRHVTASTPVVLGGTLVVPAGLLRKLRGEFSDENETNHNGSTFSCDPAARSRIEQIGMAAVRKAEEGRGCTVVDVSSLKCGWDLTSYPPHVNGKQPQARHIEVKARIKSATTITATKNEILYALNQADKFLLAIVLVDGDEDGARHGSAVDGPYYVRKPFDSEPGWGVTSVNFEIKSLLERGETE